MDEVSIEFGNFWQELENLFDGTTIVRILVNVTDDSGDRDRCA